MPSNYAHYRFGTLLLPTLPADVRGPITRHRRLYEFGLQGPDFFLYHNYFSTTAVRRLSSDFHEQSGREFFARICAHLGQNPPEAGLSYLYGLLAHYCLDSTCHPTVYAITDRGAVSHTELETEFDRFLLSRDGVKNPHTHHIGASLGLSREECAAVAPFYPPATAADIRRCGRNMALALKLLANPAPPVRFAVGTALRLAGGTNEGLVMHTGPNPKCADLNDLLLEKFHDAEIRFPEYLERLRSHLTYNAPLGQIFDPNFNRG